jgi:hypothetical protein
VAAVVVALVVGVWSDVLPDQDAPTADQDAPAEATLQAASRRDVPGADQRPAEPSARPDLGPRTRPRAGGPGPRSRPTIRPAAGRVVRAAAVLRAWDESRARAWAEGDATRLRGLYVDRAGAADVRLLRRYAARGLRVEDLTTQLLAVEVLRHGPGRWRLRVTDRLAGGVVVGAHDRFRLPRDRADTRLVRLVRSDDGTWRVAQVSRFPR